MTPNSRPLAIASLFALIGMSVMAGVPESAATAPAHVLPPLLLLWDTGINPYHKEFRLPADFVAPPGYYPEDAIRIRLSLDAADYESAVAADAEVWGTMEFDTLYAFEGTRIVGAIEHKPNCITCPNPILDDNGHGTHVAGAYAGLTSGSCPACRIFVGTGVDIPEWAMSRTDIDAISNSQGSLGGIGLNLNSDKWIHEWTTNGRTWFTSAGNGPPNLINHLDSYSGPVGSIRVGGLHNMTASGGTRTFEVVGDAEQLVPSHQTMDTLVSRTGTSLAAPDVAGLYLQMLWHARLMVNGGGWTPSGLTVAAPDATRPGTGPLQDGVLSASELEDVLMKTASAVPPPVPGLPRELSYFWEGYGAVDARSLVIAMEVLRGERDLPDRPWPDYWHAYDDYIRSAWGGGLSRCRADLDTSPQCLAQNAQTAPWAPPGYAPPIEFAA